MLTGRKPISMEENEIPKGVNGRAGAEMYAGLGLLLFFFVGFGGWAALAPLDSAAIASGMVTVQGKKRAIQHRDGGIVDELLVRDGDRVEKGDVLIRLDATDAKASLEVLQSQLDYLLAKEARLMAERDQRDEIEFPEVLIKQAEELHIKNALDEQRRFFHARRKAHEGEISLLEQRISQLEADIVGYDAQRRAQHTQLQLLRKELENVRKLNARGYESNLKVMELQRQIAFYEGEGGEYLSNVNGAYENIALTRKEMEQVQHRQLERVMSDLVDVHAQIADIRPRIRATTEQLNRIELKANEDGFVLGLNVAGSGAVVKQGETIMEIVPENDALIVEARLNTNDIDSVYAGMEAKVRFNAYNQVTIRPAKGFIEHVSADVIVDQRTDQDYYLVRIRIDDEDFLKANQVILVPGMSAEAIIPTGSRTVLQYLLNPLVNRFETAFREQ